MRCFHRADFPVLRSKVNKAHGVPIFGNGRNIFRGFDVLEALCLIQQCHIHINISGNCGIQHKNSPWLQVYHIPPQALYLTPVKPSDISRRKRSMFAFKKMMNEGIIIETVRHNKRVADTLALVVLINENGGMPDGLSIPGLV